MNHDEDGLSRFQLRQISADDHRLKTFGMFSSTGTYSRKPELQPDGSIRFTAHMYIPAMMLFVVGCIAPIVWTIQIWPITSDEFSSLGFFLSLSALGVFLLLAMFVLVRWRAVEVHQSGQVTFVLPWMLWHRSVTHEPGTVWVDPVVGIKQESTRFSILERWRNQRLQAMTGGKVFGTPALVVHDGERAFVIAQNSPQNAHTLYEQLIHEFSLQSSDKEIILAINAIF